METNIIGLVLALNASFGGPGWTRGPDWVPTAADWSAWIVYHTLGTSSWPPGPPKGLVLAQNAPFGSLGGTRRAPGSQIWSQQAKVCGNHDSNLVGPICSDWDQIWPQVWPPELLSQLGPVLGRKGPLGPLVSTYKAPEWANMTYNYVSDPWVVF